MQEEEVSADTCAEAAEDVCEELCELDVDTEHVGALVVAADRIEITSELCPSEEAEKKDDDNECDDDADFNVSRHKDAFLVYRTHEGNRDLCSAQFDEGFVSDGNTVAAHYRGHAFREEQTRERYYERLELHVSYEGITISK